MKLTDNSQNNKEARKNRSKFLKKIGVKNNLVASAELIHGNNVVIVSESDAGNVIRKTDGLITAKENLFLSITVADCLPIFVYEPQKEIIGLVHAGWRGLSENILPITVKKIINNFGSLPKDILIGIGPGISQCHFEVKEDLLKNFESYLPTALLMREGRNFLDLKKIAEIQLINSGIKEKNIEVSSECTFCLKNKYFSFRRDKKIRAMMAVIGKR